MTAGPPPASGGWSLRFGARLAAFGWFGLTVWLLTLVDGTFGDRWLGEADPPEMLAVGMACWLVLGAWSVRAEPVAWPILLLVFMLLTPLAGARVHWPPVPTGWSVNGPALSPWAASRYDWVYRGPIQLDPAYVAAAILGGFVQAQLLARRGVAAVPHCLIDWERRLRSEREWRFPASPDLRWLREIVKPGPMLAVLVWWGLTLLSLRELALRGDAGWSDQAVPGEMILVGSAAWLLMGAWSARACPLLWPGLCMVLLALARLGGCRDEVVTFIVSSGGMIARAGNWPPGSGPSYVGAIQQSPFYLAAALLGGLLQAELLCRRGVPVFPRCFVEWERRRKSSHQP
jgi:hypothetical protein